MQCQLEDVAVILDHAQLQQVLNQDTNGWPLYGAAAQLHVEMKLSKHVSLRVTTAKPISLQMCKNCVKAVSNQLTFRPVPDYLPALQVPDISGSLAHLQLVQ